jgi:protoporphyrinogen oxidase
VPAPVAASLLAPAVGGAVDLSFLRAIRHASVTVVHLGFESGIGLPRGFGYLVPPDADDRGAIAPRALGTIFTSNLFDHRTPAGGASIASFYRGADVAGLDAARMVDLAVADLRMVLEASERASARDGTRTADLRPKAHFIRRWSDVIPRYEPDHDERVDRLLDGLRDLELGLHLGASFTRGVSVDAVIVRGRAVAREVLFQEQYA